MSFRRTKWGRIIQFMGFLVESWWILCRNDVCLYTLSTFWEWITTLFLNIIMTSLLKKQNRKKFCLHYTYNLRLKKSNALIHRIGLFSLHKVFLLFLCALRACKIMKNAQILLAIFELPLAIRKIQHSYSSCWIFLSA